MNILQKKIKNPKETSREKLKTAPREKPNASATLLSRTHFLDSLPPSSLYSFLFFFFQKHSAEFHLVRHIFPAAIVSNGPSSRNSEGAASSLRARQTFWPKRGCSNSDSYVNLYRAANMLIYFNFDPLARKKTELCVWCRNGGRFARPQCFCFCGKSV